MLGINSEGRGSADGWLAAYYTRCPVPTATGIAVNNGIFDRLFAGTRYALRNIAELGGDHANAHFTHSIVIRYLQGLLRAAAWAPRHAPETRNIVARECAVDARAIDRYLSADYTGRLMPAITPELLRTVEVLKSFLLDRGYLAGDFAVADWVDPEPLREAELREQGVGV